jgi:hypothetical protein
VLKISDYNIDYELNKSDEFRRDIILSGVCKTLEELNRTYYSLKSNPLRYGMLEIMKMGLYAKTKTFLQAKNEIQYPKFKECKDKGLTHRKYIELTSR